MEVLLGNLFLLLTANPDVHRDRKFQKAQKDTRIDDRKKDLNFDTDFH